MAKDKFVAWATDGEMFGEPVEVTDVDDTGDGHCDGPLVSVDLVVGDEPEDGVEVELSTTPDDEDELRVALANAIFARNAAHIMMLAIARNADAEARKASIEASALRTHIGRLDRRLIELTELVGIYEQEMGYPVPAPRPGLLARLLSAVLPWA